MSEQIVKGKAPWLMKEVTPLLITLAIGLAGAGIAIVTGINELRWVYPMTGPTIMAVIGLGLTAFLWNVNRNRKRKSTLMAELKNDPAYNVRVWMVSPNKQKWKGRLNNKVGVNEFPLVGKHRVELEDVLSTQVLVFRYATGKQGIIPVRFLRDNEDIALYVAKARALSEWVTNKEVDAVLDEYLPEISAEDAVLSEEQREIVDASETVEVEEEDTWDESAVYGERSDLADEIPLSARYKNVRRIAYPNDEEEEEKTVGEQVVEQLDAAERKQAEEEQATFDSAFSNLGLFDDAGNASKSITIDIPSTTDK